MQVFGSIITTLNKNKCCGCFGVKIWVAVVGNTRCHAFNLRFCRLCFQGSSVADTIAMKEVTTRGGHEYIKHILQISPFLTNIWRHQHYHLELMLGLVYC